MDTTFYFRLLKQTANEGFSLIPCLVLLCSVIAIFQYIREMTALSQTLLKGYPTYVFLSFLLNTHF